LSEPPARVRTGGRSALGVLAVLALLVQVVVLYAPSSPDAPLFAGADKVVHVLVFAVPVLLLLLAGAPAPLVVGALGLHAVVSEVVQWVVLPGRSGDPLDVVADLAGIALGWGLWRLAWRRSGSAHW
jgi:hypothetical protein